MLGEIFSFSGTDPRGFVTQVEQHGRMLDRSCRLPRPHALELARAFEVSNDILRAPIASDDYVAACDARTRPPQ